MQEAKDRIGNGSECNDTLCSSNPQGDGPLVLTAYCEISTLHSAVTIQHYPNVAAIAKKESAGNTCNEQQLLRYATNCVRPAYEYSETTL